MSISCVAGIGQLSVFDLNSLLGVFRYSESMLIAKRIVSRPAIRSGSEELQDLSSKKHQSS